MNRPKNNNKIYQPIIRFKQLIAGLLIGCFIGYNLHSNNNKSVETSSTNTSRNSNNNNLKTIKGSLTSSSSFLGEGWRNIHVFAGDTNLHLHERLKARGDINSNSTDDTSTTTTTTRTIQQRWFSQNGQDRIVSHLLRNRTNGYFIDLASNDAISMSNTLGLEYNHNWTGLCMEANPYCWYSLAYYRQCQVVAAVVGGPNHTQVDFVYQGSMGGIHGSDFDNSNPQGKSRSKFQITVSLLEIFQLHHVPYVIDYLSLDVEGAEGWIMEHFPFHTYKFLVLSIERPKPALKELLQRNGYQLLNDQFTRFGETMWAHESILSELDKTAFDVSYTYRNDEAHQVEFNCV